MFPTEYIFYTYFAFTSIFLIQPGNCPNVHVLDHGGTLSSHEYPVVVKQDPKRHGGIAEVQKTEVRPLPGKVWDLLQKDVPDIEHFHITYEQSEFFGDSAFYATKELMGICRRVLQSLLNREGSLIIPCGTDTAASIMHVIAESVPPELLGDRCILGVAAQKHASPNRPADHEGPFYPPNTCEPVKSLSNALFIATSEFMRGRIGMLCGKKVLAARGFQKFDALGSEPFLSRFKTRVSCENEKQPLPRWEFDAPIPAELPRGKGHDYVLEPGVESMVLDPSSDYQNVPNMIWGALKRRKYDDDMPDKTGRLRGLVLQVPGDRNLRTNNDRDMASIREGVSMAREAGVPVAVAAHPLYREHHRMPNITTQYEGNVTNLLKSCAIIDGRYLSSTEARLLMSASVARARNQHGLRKGRIVTYVEEYFRRYEQFLQTGSDTE